MSTYAAIICIWAIAFILLMVFMYGANRHRELDDEDETGPATGPGFAGSTLPLSYPAIGAPAPDSSRY